MGGCDGLSVEVMEIQQHWVGLGGLLVVYLKSGIVGLVVGSGFGLWFLNI